LVAWVKELPQKMTADFYLTAIGHAGNVVFAATGAVVAARKRMDLFGAITLAVVTAIGGGTLRDMLIGQVPVFWVHDQAPLWIAAVTGMIVFVLGHSISLRPGVLLIPDAIGLALFTWVGCEKTFLLELSTTAVLIMGVITGTAGGIIRDVLSDHVPGVFVKGELYATASLAGSIAYVILRGLNVDGSWTGCVCVGLVFLIRISALRWKIALPVYGGSVSE